MMALASWEIRKKSPIIQVSTWLDELGGGENTHPCALRWLARPPNGESLTWLDREWKRIDDMATSGNACVPVGQRAVAAGRR